MTRQFTGYIAAVGILLAWLCLGTTTNTRLLLDAPYTGTNCVTRTDAPAASPETSVEAQSSPSQDRAETMRKKKSRSVRTFLVFDFAPVVTIVRVPVTQRHVPVPSVWVPTASTAVLSKAGVQRLFQKA